MTNATKA
jgi:hypothetical protein